MSKFKGFYRCAVCNNVVTENDPMFIHLDKNENPIAFYCCGCCNHLCDDTEPDTVYYGLCTLDDMEC